MDIPLNSKPKLGMGIVTQSLPPMAKPMQNDPRAIWGYPHYGLRNGMDQTYHMNDNYANAVLKKYRLDELVQ